MGGLALFADSPAGPWTPEKQPKFNQEFFGILLVSLPLFHPATHNPSSQTQTSEGGLRGHIC